MPGQIEELLNELPLERSGIVSFGGIRREVNLAYVPDAEVGDYVIVHVGFAISKLHEQEAQRVFLELERLASNGNPAEEEG
ncbi:HypC/HybG/HupF family hydrogenase formation chaperone [Microbulbifer guangxiensis]|uniref:HypC/HybG/HupF family hydrogenase formation chaperone n=1 Tax=Microbulbifer guangxiensis TaxID=2904249 RepID=UPI001F20FA0B